MDNVIDGPLHRVELAPVGILISLWKLQDRGSKHLIRMSTANHKRCQPNEEALYIICIVMIAVVMLEDLEAARVRNTEELELRIELSEVVENWSPAESPLVLRHQGAAGNGRACNVILDRLCLVEHYA